MLNPWENTNPDGFLADLRDSEARKFCRNFISERVTEGSVRSIMEIGVGGLNERIAMDDMFKAHPEVSYAGVDWAMQFLAEGCRKFPKDSWDKMDIVKAAVSHPRAHLVYSQHVLEHCHGLCPALGNMLDLAGKYVVNIFFLPPIDSEDKIDFSMYPLYHNTYSIEHIRVVCRAHGFTSEFSSFPNETVLIAERHK